VRVTTGMEVAVPPYRTDGHRAFGNVQKVWWQNAPPVSVIPCVQRRVAAVRRVVRRRRGAGAGSAR